jgi:hypothetical protein
MSLFELWSKEKHEDIFLKFHIHKQTTKAHSWRDLTK